MPGHIHRSTSGASAGFNSTHEHSRLECRGARFLSTGVIRSEKDSGPVESMDPHQKKKCG